MARFIDAIKLWSEKTGRKYKIPRKGTGEYTEVMEVFEQMKKKTGGAGMSVPAPAPKMAKADKALAREEAKFQAGRLRAIAKDEASAARKLARAEAKFQAGRLRAMAKDKAEAMKKK
jgi:hypothetical protein